MNNNIMCLSQILLPLGATGWYSGLDIEMWASSPELQVPKKSACWQSWHWSWKWKLIFCGSSIAFTFLPLDSFYSPSPSPRLFCSFYILVWQRNEDLNIIKREETWLTVQHSLIPVLVDLIGQGDDIALVEGQLALVFWLKIVECLTAWLLQSWNHTRIERMRNIGWGKKDSNMVDMGGGIQDAFSTSVRKMLAHSKP